ncbi:phosphoglycerate kinase [Nitratifractor salsuginis]|uniref:Phosphoglycerate kinase n=1 Tax=Nitratifractor salsuginis (strain DSM 16511 / JCM 12458 / E9I37-1) TaxID=749222 RepID=E6WZ09_NITSE|nr:phosphoglycerate kinase [Nitratifractor salsuginis]ADV45459.1 phosphoglycerate kinase [Nitratifractor salsuginis DSM 16511]
MLKTIKDLEIDGSTVFIRCDFNVPIDEFGNITDDRRIRAALPTIRYCLDRDCKVVLGSHFERPEPGKFEERFSLFPVYKRLDALLKIKNHLYFDDSKAGAVITPRAKELFGQMEGGDVLLLENLRFDPGETKDDIEFAKKLSEFGEFYVNDAFGACHRKHASIHAIASLYDKEHKAAGFLLAKEVNFFAKVLENPSRPFVAVVGGSKVSGKLEALNRLISKVDKLVVGGGMAFTFLKAQGYEVGKSLVEEDLIDEARTIMYKAKKNGVKFYLPVDVVVAPEMSETATVKYLPTQEIPAEWMGLDIGPASTRLFREALNDAHTIMWNGPMGVYEMERFAKGSIKMSHYIAESHATTIVGGGDTADVAARAGDVDEMTFVSTGGGASLKLIEGEELPGIVALQS